VTGLDRAHFLTHLTSELVSSGLRREFNNIDRTRFERASSVKTTLKEKLLGLAGSLGFYRASVINHDLLKEVLKTEGLDCAYGLLQDQPSRDLFVKLLAYRILGDRHVRLPLNNREYWKVRRSVDRYVETRRTVTGIPILGSLDLFNFNGIRLHAHMLNILNTFLLEQYRCARASIGVGQGDVAIDAGGCWGDTALYFARNAERVFCFECMPSNIRIIEQNLRMNTVLSPKIKVIRKALWSRPNEKLLFTDRGPGSRAGSDGPGVSVETETLDHFVSANSIGRVDFLKMDIEGAELEALVGAVRTIRSDRPHLAISVYHSLEDFACIPRWVDSLNLGYEFYLDHFTIHQEETILFAKARK
jgi:FkbM family methyltransferase